MTFREVIEDLKQGLPLILLGIIMLIVVVAQYQDANTELQQAKASYEASVSK